MKQDINQKIHTFLKEEKLTIVKKKLLLAVSGGADSMALLHLLKHYHIAVAHCNFDLREVESLDEQKFVEQSCLNLNIPFYTITFDTKKEVEQSKKSIQVVARELRYAWLEKIRKENNFDYIVTAHHADDQVETMIANIIRGTGIKGLRAMLPLRDNILRPLLTISKEEILAFISTEKIDYKTDSSNLKNDYSRNKIRNQIIPLLEEINPHFKSTALSNIALYKHIELLSSKQLKKIHDQLFLKKNNRFEISITLLKKQSEAQFVLYDFLKDFNFNPDQCEQIINTLDAISGKQFLSSSHRIIKDRRVLILEAIKDSSFFPTSFSIDLNKNEGEELLVNGKLKWKIVKYNNDLEISKSPNFAYINKDKISDTLLLRQWRKGDYFYPFGMNMKKKKISKFFKDQKVNVADKENTWILSSGESIVWVANHRIDERFAISEKSKEVILFEWENK
jgi:tRNA(Ile)-lysidine synthase